MSDDRKVVWILGAGFSRSLGGPLLSDLFTLESQDRIFSTYDFRDEEELYFKAITRAYWYGLKNESILSEKAKAELAEYTTIRENLWEHSEEFLERLDIAAESEESRAAFVLFKKIFALVANRTFADSQKKLLSVRTYAKKLFAAECDMFLDNNPASGERWIPYKYWAGRLNPNDTVLTFNYDKVLEKLKQSVRNNNIMIPTPTEVNKNDYDRNKTLVYKLHGSINWYRDNEEIHHIDNYPESNAYFLSINDLAIATPGSSKQMLVQKTHLGLLWKKAVDTITGADIIIFLGYRFPPTDSYSRELILSHIKNRTRPPEIYTVLGRDINHEDSVGLRALLRRAGIPSGAIEQIPLRAEEYIGGADFH